MGKLVSKRKVIRDRGRIVVRHRVETLESEELSPSPRLRAENKSLSTPRQRGRGRGIHLDLDRGDD